ncbi:arsenate reductase (azurin) large subunit [Halomonas alkalisoli]|uniref:arsenate reductase (azurin) large subunit n=1 Tax=Halomonas alkalisoli TaxID=2907158 RepID=UPI001F483B72|nr:arsenate reductase (azurin) large subunit [Halomonas alkalisoli]MCE9682498.1 arsenate reductase (azurin) large subunit [Halomonas alkalisoli]
MSEQHHQSHSVYAKDQVPLPPKDAEVITTACDYCTVACGYKVYRWPAGREGGPSADQNIFGLDYPPGRILGPWVSPSQHNIVRHEGKPHHVVVISDFDADVVNKKGDHSIRGGTLAQKCYNPENRTSERLLSPMIRVRGNLVPVSWDLAAEAMADISKYIIEQHGEHAWAMKMYSYQYFENTYALTKLAMRGIRTPALAPHDKPTWGQDAAGLDDTGINSFAASYEDWGMCDVAFMSGVDPYETKTILFNEYLMRGTNPGKKLIFVTPHMTTGVAYGVKNGGLWLPIIPGTDALLHNALARIIIENDWQDQEFIDQWVANKWEVESGYGRGTRNTPWQWRTTWGTWQSDWEDFKQFILSRDEHKLENAAAVTGIKPEDIQRCAEMIAKPREDGSRPKTSFMLEKGNYWSNNYMNTTSIGALGLICGSGNRPGRVISRGGGHQRGMMSAGGGAGWLSPEKYPGRRKKPLNLDRWTIDGHVKFAWVVGNTWMPGMLASQELTDVIKSKTSDSPHQIASLDRAAIFETLKRRVDDGGMVIVDSDIYPVEGIGTRYADIVLPAATWGEESFTRCNSERRLRLYNKFYDAPGQSRPDWQHVQIFAQKMGLPGFDWKDSNEVFEEAARFGRGGVLDYFPLVQKARREGVRGHDLLGAMGTTGIQTPIRELDGELVGTVRLHDPTSNGAVPGENQALSKILYGFGTHSGKAVLLKSPWDYAGWSEFYAAAQPRKEKGEIWITNGRVNEIWQSGFDDKRKPYLSQRWPYSWIVINPVDAEPRGIETGDLVESFNDAVYVQTGQPIGIKPDDLHFNKLMETGHIRTTTGMSIAVAIVSDQIREGVAISNFLAPDAPANSLCHAVPDPMTNNYRYKLGRGVLRKVGESVYKHNFTAMSLKPRNIV